MSYRWVPAHCIPTCNDTYMCITYEKNRVSKCEGTLEEKVGQGHKRSIIRCPDRTLIIFNKPEYKPQSTSYDEFINLNVFSDQGIFNDIGIGLISAEFRNDIRTPVEIPKSHILIGDSGGYQLRVGKIPFLDPYQIINWMNNFGVTVGISIDIASREGDPSEEDACIESTRRNNLIFRNYRRKDLRLLNTIHGFTAKSQRIWAEKLEDDYFDGWGIGGECSMTNTIHGAMMLRSKYKGNHYHMFAKGATQNAIVFSWLGKYIPLLTSDSTTYRNSGMSREIQLMTPNGMMQMFHVGKIKEYQGDVATHIPCNCAVCSKIRYIDVYGLASRFKTERLLTWHNMLTLHSQASFWDKTAQSSTYDEYIDKVKSSVFADLSGRVAYGRFKTLQEYLDLIEDFHSDYSGTYKKKKSLLNDTATIAEQNASLFGMFGKAQEKQGKRTLKSAKLRQEAFRVEVDCLPNYLNYDELLNLEIVSEYYEGYEQYHEQVKQERKEVIKRKGDAESYDVRFLRKHPYRKLKHLRKHQLKKEKK